MCCQLGRLEFADERAMAPAAVLPASRTHLLRSFLSPSLSLAGFLFTGWNRLVHLVQGGASGVRRYWSGRARQHMGAITLCRVALKPRMPEYAVDWFIFDTTWAGDLLFPPSLFSIGEGLQNSARTRHDRRLSSSHIAFPPGLDEPMSDGLAEALWSIVATVVTCVELLLCWSPFLGTTSSPINHYC
jgi:hypothetical protein